MRFIDASYSIKLSGQDLCKGEHCAGLDKKRMTGDLFIKRDRLLTIVSLTHQRDKKFPGKCFEVSLNIRNLCLIHANRLLAV